MIHGSGISGVFGVVLFASMAPTNSAQKFPDYPVRQPSSYRVAAQQDEVSIGLDSVESVPDQLTYFHTTLSPNGFLPVLVVVHNRSKSDSLLLDKGAITYGFGDSDKAAPKENSVGQKVAISTTSAIPFIGPFIAMGLAKDASEVKQNLMLRELQSQTISPGDTAHGFLYLPIPKKGLRPKMQIHVPIAWAGSDKTSMLHLEF